ALIWSSGEYRVKRISAPLVGHSPLRVDGWPCAANCGGTGVPTKTCPATCGAAPIRAAMVNPRTETETSSFCGIVHLPGSRELSFLETAVWPSVTSVEEGNCRPKFGLLQWRWMHGGSCVVLSALRFKQNGMDAPT